jgi:vacuolar-type H+-ATPase subunit I/STV1
MYGSTSVGPNVNNANDWLTIFDQCSERVQMMQEAVTKRNERLRNDSKSSNDFKIAELNAKLKKDLRTLTKDLDNLDSALSKLTMEISGNEIGRRRDLLNELKHRKDEVLKMLNKKQTTNAKSGDRKNLLGDGDYGKKGQYADNEEPEAIKGMDSHQVLAYQEKVMEEQDKGLDVLSAALDRTKHLGLAISDELDEHKVLLDDLDRDVERTDHRIKKETRRIDKLLRSSKTPFALCIIFVLFCVIIALIIIVLKFSNVF